MFVCADCFHDEEIKHFIANFLYPVVDRCDCCGRQATVIDLNELADFFVELLRLFEKDENGIEIVSIIQRDWNIFNSKCSAEKILSHIIDIGNFSFTITDKVSYISEIKDCFTAWRRLKFDVRDRRRYFSDLGTFNWETYITTNARITVHTHLYRARITPADINKLKLKEMGCPPTERATAGRANPVGIPYLYLCNDIETSFYEVRAVYLDRLSIGHFITLRDLDVVDFSNRINLFYTYSELNDNLVDIVKRKILFDQISADLSKPLRRFDTEVEYVPTQLICEYCKLNGADGIRYNSSLQRGGVNVVLFNSSDVRCTKVSVREIKSVKIESK